MGKIFIFVILRFFFSKQLWNEIKIQFQEEAFKLNKIPKKNPLFEVFRAGAHSYPQFMENADLLNKEFNKIKLARNITSKEHSQYNFSIEINKGSKNACKNN